MTIREEQVTLWNDGSQRLLISAAPEERQYKYIEGIPCITVGFTYEDEHFKGYDEFTFFGERYTELLKTIKDVYDKLSGHIRLYDMGADTDGFIEIDVEGGKLNVSGQLGASFWFFSLKFSLDADQTLLLPLLDCLR